MENVSCLCEERLDEAAASVDQRAHVRVHSITADRGGLSKTMQAPTTTTDGSHSSASSVKTNQWGREEAAPLGAFTLSVRDL